MGLCNNPSSPQPSSPTQNVGLTLIEVLIALAILSIALMAIIKATSQNIRDSTYLQNKMIATWVGTQVVNAIRANLIKPPMAPDHMEKETVMLGQSWSWNAIINSTPNPTIKEINVDVYKKSSGDKLVHLVGYMYVAK